MRARSIAAGIAAAAAAAAAAAFVGASARHSSTPRTASGAPAAAVDASAIDEHGSRSVAAAPPSSGPSSQPSSAHPFLPLKAPVTKSIGTAYVRDPVTGEYRETSFEMSSKEIVGEDGRPKPARGVAESDLPPAEGRGSESRASEDPR